MVMIVANFMAITVFPVIETVLPVLRMLYSVVERIVDVGG